MANRGQIYKKINGKFQWVNEDGSFAKGSKSKSPFVHQDTLKKPLRNMATGTIHDSTSAYLRECKEKGLEVVGNDLLSGMKHQIKEKITDERVMDAIERAESIVSDPAKLRAERNRQEQLHERNERLIHGRG